jgi:hypothetical protein
MCKNNCIQTYHASPDLAAKVYKFIESEGFIGNLHSIVAKRSNERFCKGHSYDVVGKHHNYVEIYVKDDNEPIGDPRALKGLLWPLEIQIKQA